VYHSDESRVSSERHLFWSDRWQRKKNADGKTKAKRKPLHPGPLAPGTTSAMIKSMLPLPNLSPVSGKSVVATFDVGLLSSDGGVLMLREVEQRLRIADRFRWLHQGSARTGPDHARSRRHHPVPPLDEFACRIARHRCLSGEGALAPGWPRAAPAAAAGAFFREGPVPGTRSHQYTAQALSFRLTKREWEQPPSRS
jgi:hypothetical protein